MQRKYAEKLILGAVGERLLQNPAWADAVFDLTIKTFRQLCADTPNAIRNKETALAAIQQKVTNLLDMIELGTAPPDVHNRLRQRTAERDKLSRELETLSRQRDQSPPNPTREWVQGELERLEDLLKQGGPAAALVLRKIVGGEITVTEVRREGSKRHYLRGRFRITASSVASALRDSGLDPVELDTDAVSDEIVIDFRRPEIAERIADSAKELWDQGLKYIEIAKSLGWNRNLIQKAIAHWHHWRGLPIPDGRSYRKRLKKPRLAELILEQVMDLERKGYPYGVIAKQLGCDFSIVTEAVKLHHQRQGLSAPDGRTRRKELRTG